MRSPLPVIDPPRDVAARGRRVTRLAAATAFGLGVLTAFGAPAQALPTGATSAVTAAATAAPVAADHFNRSVTGGWGPATLGGSWTSATGPGVYAVANGAGKQSIGQNETSATYLNSISRTDTDVRLDVALDRKAGTGSRVYSSVLAREVKGKGDYRARLGLTWGGAVEVLLAKGSTTLAKAAVPGVAYAPGTKLSVRTQVTGTNPTSLRAKVWKAGTAEPSAWQVAATDSTAGLQAPGRVTLSTWMTGTTTRLTASYSALTIAPTTAPIVAPIVAPPVNVGPVAAFTAGITGLSTSLDASASTDADGSVASYLWSHGDGATSTGRQASHSYSTSGTYQVTLTVTDDRGAKATTTRSVSVTKPSTVARDPWRHPFASTSPWNTAIGSGVRLEGVSGSRTARFLGGVPVVNRAQWSIAVVRATTADPLVKLENVRGKTSYSIRIPANTAPTGGLDRPVTVVQPDGVTAYDVYKMEKVSASVWRGQWVTVQDLRASGIGTGVRAAAVPAVAGLVRKHELAEKKIPHALAMSIPGSMLRSGYVWPAARQDYDAATSYSGTVPMGTLFTIPAGVNVEAMALSPEGKALARALQDYGAYVVDRSETVALYCELACDSAGTERMKADWRVLYKQMRAVTNSAATSVGGGGTPRVASSAALS